MQCVACDEALRLCGELRTETMARVTERAAEHLSRWAEGLEIGVTIFSKASGVLGQTANVSYLMEKMIKT